MRANKPQTPSLINPTAGENTNQGYSRRIQALEEQITLMKYAFQNILLATQDLPNIKSQVEALDYRTLGLLGAAANVFSGLGTLPAADIDEKKAVYTQFYRDLVEQSAKDAKVAAFDELSKKDDELRNLANADSEEISEAHTMIFTSDCAANAEAGVLRSKVEVGSPEFGELKDKFLGKRVGETVAFSLHGREHVATILALRKAGASE